MIRALKAVKWRSWFVKIRAKYGTVNFSQILILKGMKGKADRLELRERYFGRSLGRRCMASKVFRD